MPVSSKEFLDIQANMECRFTLKRVRDMIRTYSQMHCTDKYSQHSSIIWPVWLNGWVFVYEVSGCMFKFIAVIKGYLCYKKFFAINLFFALDMSLMNSFTSRKDNVSFLRYLNFCVFGKSIGFKICDIITDIDF